MTDRKYPVKNYLITSAALLSSVFLPSQAQHHGHAHHPANASHMSPYAAMQSRTISGLSEQQIDSLRNGKGMGMAMPAELNGYPGPLHTLELASKLKLSDEQVARTKQLYAEMQTQAKADGERVIAAERALDALFAEKKANPENVASASLKIAIAQGELRATHLSYHLVMMDVLSTEQVAAYNQLRGY